MNECAFEPDATEIRCAECGGPTYESGTCQDIGFCAKCRAMWIDIIGEQEFSEMVIGMIEGEHYRAKYAPRRVLHLAFNGRTACNAAGGPHPTTANKTEVNCKRCLAKEKGQSRGN